MCVGIPVVRKMMLPEPLLCALTSDDDSAVGGSNEFLKSSRCEENNGAIGHDGGEEEIEIIEYELSQHRENFLTNKLCGALH